jgi:hypothetical protein
MQGTPGTEIEKTTKNDSLSVQIATELDTAAVFMVGDDGPLDPAEALRVRYVLCS